MKLALSFDIERSGPTNRDETIAIGAAVVDEDFNELDRLLLLGYFPNDTKFDEVCWNQFWSEHIDILKTLIYKGSLTKEERQLDMITQFQDFRAKWEEKSEKNGDTLILVSDNNVYDGGFINDMIYKYLPDHLPIPYTVTTKSYDNFYETGSIFRGIVSVVDPSYKKEYGFTYRANKLYDVPEKKYKHTHNPADDAYGIAFDFQVSVGIAKGTIKLKKILKT